MWPRGTHAGPVSVMRTDGVCHVRALHPHAFNRLRSFIYLLLPLLLSVHMLPLLPIPDCNWASILLCLLKHWRREGLHLWHREL
jgi:hypothetical protein